MRKCAQCGSGLVRRSRESYAQFGSRQYCSRRCRGLAENPRLDAGVFASRYRKIKTPDGRVMLEHRYVMELVLGRPLRSDEQVHHKNHDRLDNRPENLEVVSSAEHGLRHTIHATSKACVICGEEFVPHKTKRVRAQTCGPECKRALLSLRNRERSFK